jgi:hypothetical protein
MKIALINYEQGLGMDAILSKYARHLERELIDLGHEVIIAPGPVKGYLNHHINFVSYVPSGEKETTMITHLTGDKTWTEEMRIKMAVDQSKKVHGICMNPYLVERLVKEGVPKEKLSYVYHAHDGRKRRPRIISMVYNVYPDGRQREYMFVEMFEKIKDKKNFIFYIMGKNWMPILEPLVKQGLQVNYAENFTADLYGQMLDTSDYLLFTGDEDSLAQSIVDATNAGLRVIAPPQQGIDVEYPFNNQQELDAIFAKMEENPVKDWTWTNYAIQHCAIWEKLLEQKNETQKPKNRRT